VNVSLDFEIYGLIVPEGDNRSKRQAFLQLLSTHCPKQSKMAAFQPRIHTLTGSNPNI